PLLGEPGGELYDVLNYVLEGVFLYRHAQEEEAKLDRPPKQMKLLEKCYKKKVDGGWSWPRALEVA
ncbi:UNVERIFIED_CONTAM: hypothetical protein Sindi_1853300, partial [Sesamum indicum]